MTLEDLVRGYMDPIKGAKEDEVYVACPFCGDDQRRMGINVVSGLAHCFRASCEWKTSDRRHLFRELSKVLAVTERMDDRIGKLKIKREHLSQAKCRLPIGYETFGDLDDEVEKAAWMYLTERGVSKKQIKQHQLGFAAVGEQAWRIIIPIFVRGKLQAYTGRDFSGKQEPKYKNSKGPKFLYNVPRNKKNKCVLFEGPFDVWAGERAIESYDLIGRLGAGLTSNALRELLDYDEITIWPDPDKGGIELCVSAAKSLDSRGRRVKIVMPEESDTDPGKMGESLTGLQEIEARIRSAKLWNDPVRLKLRHYAAFNTPPNKKLVYL